jgi:hypothetical protein
MAHLPALTCRSLAVCLKHHQQSSGDALGEAHVCVVLEVALEDMGLEGGLECLAKLCCGGKER